MWNEIVDANDIAEFLKSIACFHDSCLKEIRYLSGAYVNPNLSMFPVNSQRDLRVIFHRQYSDMPILEVEFMGLKFMKLSPVPDNYTCEILDATLIQHDGCIYWMDCGGMTTADIDTYEGTVICSSKLRWRAVNGEPNWEPIYNSKV